LDEAADDFTGLVRRDAARDAHEYEWRRVPHPTVRATGLRPLGELPVQLALGDLLEGHRQVVLRARLHHRRRERVDVALAELVVTGVELPRALGGDDHERVLGVDALEELVDGRVNHSEPFRESASSTASSRCCSSRVARSASSLMIAMSKWSRPRNCA